ncbi:biofilm regulation phosphoprotein SiaC [Marinomonas sp. RSW2]|uniref:Biofilm regulation phosphoprotein SiaC n=1 Tax=Marinomonas maritima TaxID=2940935 RepID=A0ABT5W9S2_9GAMM|nr:biofilm regulation phosphoprotein SiaC [Marinomonas maritima]MDE8601565.1 biofilm regulation phosphoprotein SiaC [Marinomonas maritima]
MNDLLIEGTASSPTVRGEWKSGTLYMEGDSYPENSYELYGPMVAWVERYLKERSEPLTLELTLLYLNTSSIKVMMDMFDEMEERFQEGRQVAVNWYFDEENERVAELAEEFKEDCTFPFKIIGK